MKNKNYSKIIYIVLAIIFIGNVIIVLHFGNKHNLLELVQRYGKAIRNEKINIEFTALNNNVFNLNEFANTTISEVCTYTDETNSLYIIDDNKYVVNVYLSNLANENTYTVKCTVNEEVFEYGIENEKKIEFVLENEGKNACEIEIEKDGEILQGSKWSKEIYYIKSYQRQFLDELSNKGIQVTLNGTKSLEDDKKSINLAKILGSKNIKYAIRCNTVAATMGKNNDYYRELIDFTKQNNMKIYGFLEDFKNWFGERIDSDSELLDFTNLVSSILVYYDGILECEVINEPNHSGHGYVTDEDLQWYAKTVRRVWNAVKVADANTKVIAGALACNDDDNHTAEGKLSSKTFFNTITKYGAYKYADAYSYHPYDNYNNNTQNKRLTELLEKHKSFLNSYGGFIYNYVSEYGISSYEDRRINEDIQADKLVQQTILLDNYGIDKAIIYNLKNKGTDPNNVEHNFGIINNDSTPKKAYYAMKNYYQKTNGSEYIGKILMQEGNVYYDKENEKYENILEFHIYDKDGATKAIAWSRRNDYNIIINYGNFKAYDLYGKEIENTDGKLIITSSPVYIEGLPDTYFYRAISETANTKFEKYLSTYLSDLSSSEKMEEIKTEIETLKSEIEALKSKEIISQEKSEELMERNYKIGTKILSAYANKELNIKEVKVSSMLDELDDIGDSFEDLVTVTARVSNEKIEETKSSIEYTEKLINDNQNKDIVYPCKILNLSKDYNEKAEYINSLTEENDIKNGLIVSKSLHAYYLSNWAKDFTQIYLDRYEIEYSYIIGIEEGTNVETLLNNLETNETIEIYNHNNEKIEGQAVIGTGMKLRLGDGKEYTLVVTGDLNGDGKVSITDLSKMKLHLIRKQVLENEYEKAVDMNNDGNNSVTDLSIIKKYIVNK